MQPVPITTDAVSTNLDQGDWGVQHYVIKFVSAQVSEQLFVGIRVNRGSAWQWQYDLVNWLPADPLLTLIPTIYIFLFRDLSCDKMKRLQTTFLWREEEHNFLAWQPSNLVILDEMTYLRQAIVFILDNFPYNICPSRNHSDYCILEKKIEVSRKAVLFFLPLMFPVTSVIILWDIVYMCSTYRIKQNI